MNRSSARRLSVPSFCLAVAAAGMLLAGCHSGASPSSSGGSSTPPSTSSSTPATSSGGGTPLFPYALGDTWVYNATLASNTGTTTNTVTSVTPVSGGSKVTISSKEDIPGLPSTPLTETYIFNSNGSITAPYVSSPGSTVTIKSGSIVWPSHTT